jgi:hypothetical protein
MIKPMKYKGMNLVILEYKHIVALAKLLTSGTYKGAESG